MVRKSTSSFATRRVLDFVQTSKLIDLSMPIEEMLGAVNQLGEVAGYVWIWERYALIVELGDMEEVIHEESGL